MRRDGRRRSVPVADRADLERLRRGRDVEDPRGEEAALPGIEIVAGDQRLIGADDLPVAAVERDDRPHRLRLEVAVVRDLPLDLVRLETSLRCELLVRDAELRGLLATERLERVH